MNEFKKAEVRWLKAEDDSTGFYLQEKSRGELLSIKPNQVEYHYKAKQFRGIGFETYHFYLCSDDKIEEGDWVYHDNGYGTEYVSRVLGVNIQAVKLDDGHPWVPNCQKIVATTNPKLIYPRVTEGDVLTSIYGYNPQTVKQDRGSMIVTAYDTEIGKGESWTSKELNHFKELNSVPKLPNSFMDDFIENYNNNKPAHFPLYKFIDGDLYMQYGRDSYSIEEVNKLLLDVMNLGMETRQNQLNGSDLRSGNEILEDWKSENL